MAAKKPSVQELQTELDDIIAWFESDEIDIDEAVKKYERGMKLVMELEGRLTTAKNTITKIRADFGQKA